MDKIHKVAQEGEIRSPNRLSLEIVEPIENPKTSTLKASTKRQVPLETCQDKVKLVELAARVRVKIKTRMKSTEMSTMMKRKTKMVNNKTREIWTNNNSLASSNRTYEIQFFKQDFCEN